MTKKNMIESSVKAEPVKELLPKSKTPLVFISHDTRDAELAEEFSNLLRSASAGGLKSFRSSDKKATQGIEYGSEWYPAIMEKIDEATEVVCLLTHHSIDRPWILYEAGVAKGKLNTKVIGVALGIPLSAAVRGPFAQFQNLDDELTSLTKLVFELVKKVPGLDPDEKIVKSLVEAFKLKSAEIIAKNTKITSDAPKKEAIDDTSVAKIFEEVKIMFQDLPSRIQSRVDPEYRRRRRLQPHMIEEFLHMEERVNPHVVVLMLLSVYRDEFPWIYEVGIETLKVLKTQRPMKAKENAVREFLNILEFTFQHPMMREMIHSKDFHMLFRETEHFLERFLRKYLSESKEE